MATVDGVDSLMPSIDLFGYPHPSQDKGGAGHHALLGANGSAAHAAR